MAMRTTVGMVVLAFFTAACGSNTDSITAPSSSTVPVTFSGRVLDYQTSAPVRGANLAILLGGPNIARAQTDADGLYTLTVPKIGLYAINVNTQVNAATVYVTGKEVRGDILIDEGACISRYGRIIDSKSLQPVHDATVTIGPGTNLPACSISDGSGWYRCDLGCPTGLVNVNTTVFAVSHRDYPPWSQIVGRGIGRVLRADVALEHR